MAYRIEFVPSAKRQLKKLPGNARKLLGECIDALSIDPYPDGVEPISEVDHSWRVREGDYRIVYQVRNNALLILVLRVGNRREVYRHLVQSLKKTIRQWETDQR